MVASKMTYPVRDNNCWIDKLDRNTLQTWYSSVANLHGFYYSPCQVLYFSTFLPIIFSHWCIHSLFVAIHPVFIDLSILISQCIHLYSSDNILLFTIHPIFTGLLPLFSSWSISRIMRRTWERDSQHLKWEYLIFMICFVTHHLITDKPKLLYDLLISKRI